MREEIAKRLRQIYEAADAAVAAAGPRCDQSGRCCRFAEYGHTLFISQVEADYLLENAPPFHGPVDDASCPYQFENLCTAREPRPLGCRIYFCDPTYQDVAPELSERFLRDLKALCDEFGLGWRYAPLHAFLREHWPGSAFRSEDSASRLNQSASRTENRRVPLPLHETTICEPSSFSHR